MKNITKIFLLCVSLLFVISLSSCAGSGVAVGVGVYVPGAWIGPVHGGYHPPIGIGFPVY